MSSLETFLLLLEWRLSQAAEAITKPPLTYPVQWFKTTGLMVDGWCLLLAATIKEGGNRAAVTVGRQVTLCLQVGFCPYCVTSV